MNIVSETILNLSFIQCASRYSDDEIINRMTDVKYGNQLSKYLSNKNINGIQLIKTEYNND